MRSRQLESFVLVCELGSISKAAAVLNIAQPALGVQIKALEREFGVPLLVRTVTGTHPTPAGELFLEEARLMLGRLQDLKRRLREASGQAPRTLALGLTPSLSGLLTSRLMERLRTALPTVELKLFEELSHALIDHVASGKLDLALAYSVPDSRSLHRQARLDEALCLVTHPGSTFDTGGPVPLAALATAELAMPNEGDLVRRLVTGAMTAHGLVPRVAFSLDSMQAIKDVVKRGLACAILPHSAVAQEVRAGALAIRPVSEPPLTRTLFLVRRSDAEPDATTGPALRIIDELLDELGRSDGNFTSAVDGRPSAP
ncbi:LysR family nitrogen assimilation transcriptional regulator [Azospirillum agricola]|uniref:LysR family transcriptional regulator n=1 Tax=Azospirillum agricola TaxID=1720247 RepID=UPI001AE5AA59|nr:LysR family transcriptional regulator [Azospirillum agricola]MBP2231838.1 LysR family nitrogen assimilation transcriptional regulator [Azospirillum agricola]